VLTKLQIYAAAGVAFVLALFGIYWRGKSDGVEAERNEHVRRRVDAMRQAKDIRDEVESDPRFIDRARMWTKDKR